MHIKTKNLQSPSVHIYVVINNKSKTKGKNKTIDFKSNINVKSMALKEHKKSCASNLLVSIKYLMKASSMLVLLISSQFLLYHAFTLPCKGFQLTEHYSVLKNCEQFTWLYSCGLFFLVHNLDSEEGNQIKFQYLHHNLHIGLRLPLNLCLNLSLRRWLSLTLVLIDKLVPLGLRQL